MKTDPRRETPTAAPRPDTPPPRRGGVPARYERRATDRRSVSIVLPTFNEAENVPVIVERLTTILADYDHEIIVVDDDSPDRTWEVADGLAEENPRVRSIRRVGERGLSSAVLHGFHVATGRVLVVMDADLQHDETILPAMIDPVLDGEVDMTVGSREAEGGSYGDWGAGRRFVSWGGKQLACRMLGLQIGDPMSGFFAIDRGRFDRVEPIVNPRGFKILLEFLARGERPTVREVGYEFRERTRGVTKLTGSVIGAYLLALIDLVVGRVVAASVTAFAIVGMASLALRLVLYLSLERFGIAAESTNFLLAFEASAIANYWLNNRFTFARVARRGWAWLRGLLPFHVVALHGFVVQQGIASEAAGRWGTDWDSSNPLVLMAGIAVAAAGNYVLHQSITWRRRRG